MLAVPPHLLVELAGKPDGLATREGDELPPAGPKRLIGVLCDALIRFRKKQFEEAGMSCGVFAQDVLGAIRRSVVADHDLQVRIVLRQNALDTLSYVFRVLVRQHQNGDAGKFYRRAVTRPMRGM